MNRKSQAFLLICLCVVTLATWWPPRQRVTLASGDRIIPPGEVLTTDFASPRPVRKRMTNRGDSAALLEFFAFEGQSGGLLQAHDLRPGSTVEINLLETPVASTRVTVTAEGQIGAVLAIEDLLSNDDPDAAYWARTIRGDLYSASTGFVGVGTESPAARLDVHGAIAISGRTVIDDSGRFLGATLASNPLRIAADRWFEINDIGVTIRLNEPGQSFEKGTGFVFDGEDLWAGTSSGDLIRIRTSDASLDEVIEVGHPVVHVVFDGSSFWAAGGGLLSKVRRADGRIISTNQVAEIHDLLFDGRSIWASLARDDQVARIDVRTGVVSALIDVGNFPSGLAFDGKDLWVANALSGELSRIRVSDGSITTIPTQGAPVSLAFDGAHLWVGNATFFLEKRSAESGALLGQTRVDGFQIGDVLFDGEAIWVASSDHDPERVVVTKVRIQDLAILATTEVEPGFSVPSLGFDGVDLWLTNEGQDAGEIRKM